MNKIIYVVAEINGDYATLKTEDQILNTVALALLPYEIKIGDVLIFENFEYTIQN